MSSLLQIYKSRINFLQNSMTEINYLQSFWQGTTEKANKGWHDELDSVSQFRNNSRMAWFSSNWIPKLCYSNKHWKFNTRSSHEAFKALQKSCKCDKNWLIDKKLKICVKGKSSNFYWVKHSCTWVDCIGYINFSHQWAFEINKSWSCWPSWKCRLVLFATD